MHWHIGNLYVRVTGATEEETSWLAEFLSFKDQGFKPGRMSGKDRTVRLYNLITEEFPTGFAPAAFKEARAKGFTVETTDTRVVPAVPDWSVDLEWLNHHPATPEPITHQLEAVRAAAKGRRGIVWVPTGGGKTEIGAGLAKLIKCRWLFLVHRGDLLTQTAERFEKRTGEKAGMIGDGIWEPRRFTVAMFQSLWPAVKEGKPHAVQFLNEIEGVIVDECHSLAADTFWKVAMAMPSAYYRIGLSGTPLQRSDKRSVFVMAGLGKVLIRIMPETLIRQGIIAAPKIRMVRCSQLIDHPTTQGMYGAAVVRSSHRNELLLALAKRAKKPALVFVDQLAHGERLEKLIRGAGITCEFVWGEKDLALRKAAVERTVRGDTDVLIANVIFQEGVDIPSLQSVVMAYAGRSVIAALQRMGRALRATADKHDVEVWDVFDESPCPAKCAEHTSCQWLERRARARKKAYESDGHTVTLEAAQTVLDLT